mmetsp:Transcript_76444/g.175174  ORF Transcript_76444/g.175174 Transcript_76444/m.175174 type:complete len:115 (-) Transcript_76444:32-376(-)
MPHLHEEAGAAGHPPNLLMKATRCRLAALQECSQPSRCHCRCCSEFEVPHLPGFPFASQTYAPQLFLQLLQQSMGTGERAKAADLLSRLLCIILFVLQKSMTKYNETLKLIKNT